MRVTSNQLTAMGYGLDGNRIRVDTGAPVTGAAQREADLHADILAICRRNGWLRVHSRMDVPQTAEVGTPDFVIALPNARVVWVEAKSATGKLRPAQQAWLTALRALGHKSDVVRSIPEFLALVELAIKA